MIDLHALAKKAQRLQPLPESVHRLAGIISDEGWAIADVVKIVSLDPALTGQLLRLANSASVVGAGQGPSTVRGAVLRLGAGPVLSLAMAGQVGPYLSTPLVAYGFSEGELWRHSVSVALAAQELSSRTKIDIPPEAFTVALLHDLGKLILSRFLDPKIQDLLASARLDGSSPLEAEVSVLQVHHGEVGALVAQHWNLPESIWPSIANHHTPNEIENPTCDVVHIADWLVHHLVEVHEPGLADSGEALPERGKPTLEADALARLSLHHDVLNEVAETVAQKLEGVLEHYG